MKFKLIDLLLNDPQNLFEENDIFYYTYFVDSTFFRFAKRAKDNYFLLHSVQNPALTSYDLSNKIKREEWYRWGKLHRGQSLPAVTYYCNDKVIREEYWRMGHKDFKTEHNKNKKKKLK